LFYGHGKHAAKDVTLDEIELEDGSISFTEVRRSAVVLGVKYQTMVMFNACHSGSSSRLGHFRGWAESFSAREFGGFIAPLWAVDCCIAKKMAIELVFLTNSEKRSVGDALQIARGKDRAEAASLLAYLYYGDVNARFTPA
jgi:hypothetical protein